MIKYVILEVLVLCKAAVTLSAVKLQSPKQWWYCQLDLSKHNQE